MQAITTILHQMQAEEGDAGVYQNQSTQYTFSGARGAGGIGRSVDVWDCGCRHALIPVSARCIKCTTPSWVALDALYCVHVVLAVGIHTDPMQALLLSEATGSKPCWRLVHAVTTPCVACVGVRWVMRNAGGIALR